MNSFAKSAWVADRVQTSACDRRTRLMLRIDASDYQPCSSPAARVKSRKPTAPLRMTRALQ
eukprot:5133330-Pyramimonas_sp.AAC.1